MTSMLSFIHIFNHHPSPKIKMSHMIREVLKRKTDLSLSPSPSDDKYAFFHTHFQPPIPSPKYKSLLTLQKILVAQLSL